MMTIMKKVVAKMLNWPAANLFLMREKRYPGPASSMSQPDKVLPSLVNCTASGAGLLGPSASWKRANNDPTPKGTEPRNRLKVNEWGFNSKYLLDSDEHRGIKFKHYCAFWRDNRKMKNSGSSSGQLLQIRVKMFFTVISHYWGITLL